MVEQGTDICAVVDFVYKAADVSTHTGFRPPGEEDTTAFSDSILSDFFALVNENVQSPIDLR